MAENAGQQRGTAPNPSTGLPRELGFMAVLAFGVACISLSSSGLLPFSKVIGIWPGSSLVLIITFAAVFCLFHAYTYAVIGSMAPQSAADYVVASRTLPRSLAFASSWTFVIFSALTAGALIAQVPQTILPIFFRLFGMLQTPIAAMLDLADAITTPENTILFGTVLVVVTFLTMLLPARIISRIMVTGLGLGVLAWVVMFFLLATAPESGFQVAWNRAMSQGNFLEHLVSAKALGMDSQAGIQPLALGGLLMSFWFFYGYMIPTFFAGEVKRPERSLLPASLGALALTWGFFIGATFLLLRLVPTEWLASESFLHQSSQFTELSMPWLPFYAMIVQPNLFIAVFVFIAWLFTLINLFQAYFFFCSRILVAWVEDGAAPASLGYIHPGLKSPLLMVLAVATVAELAVLDASLGGVVMAQVNFVFFAALTQVIPVLAATIIPFIRKDWFESSSRLVRLKIGRVPVITLVGVVTLVFLLASAALSGIFPVMGAFTLWTPVLFAALFLSGLAWYFGYRFVRSRQDRIAAKAASGVPAD